MQAVLHVPRLQDFQPFLSLMDRTGTTGFATEIGEASHVPGQTQSVGKKDDDTPEHDGLTLPSLGM